MFARQTCAFVAACWLALTPARAEDRPAPAPIASIQAFPPQLELNGIRDSRRLIVTGKTAEGTAYDLTAAAAFLPGGPQVTVDKDGYVTPVAAGTTSVKVTAAGHAVEVPVTVQDASPQPVSFVREIMPVLSKVGCNAGTCHGAQKGKNGFKLSLRGYDPLFDYRALVDDHSGRRFNRSRPAQSLMLLKPTQGVPHEGGFLFDEDSRYYRVIEQWIAEGCRFDNRDRAIRLEVFPEKPLLQHDGDTQQLIVVAHYSDGSSRDVTRDAVFESSNFEVAEVDKLGRIKAVRRGEAAALIRYEGLYGTAPITVIGHREGFQWNDSPEYNFVDTHVNNKLRLMRILPSELCTDAEFLRRVSLDLTGVPPTGAEVRAFLADPRDSKTKRDAKIDELLDSPGYVDHWTLKWSDLLLANRKFIQEKGVWAFRNWIRHAIVTNKPYDQFVYELMTASGSASENPAANYFRIAREPKEVMENMTQVFIGTRFACAQCHDHPFERWTQQQYYELSAYFAEVGYRKSALPDDEIVFDQRAAQPVTHPGTGQNVAAHFPYEHEGMDPAADNRRKQLARWLTARENPYFAKSLVNRYWSYFTGRGIIDPVDDIRSSNPPSNPELLAALTENFVRSGFDLKWLVRTIVSSHTYQRSYRTNEWNGDDTVNYSHALPRRLAAEQLFDALMVATGAPSNIPGVPGGFRANQLPDPNVTLSFLDMFGRAPRESPCECERSSEVSLGQTLNLVNGPTVSEAIIHPQGLIARLVREKADGARLIEEVYLSVVSRPPTAEEAEAAAAYFAEVGDSAAAAQDLMWALINSPAFLFNR